MSTSVTTIEDIISTPRRVFALAQSLVDAATAANAIDLIEDDEVSFGPIVTTAHGQIVQALRSTLSVLLPEVHVDNVVNATYDGLDVLEAVKVVLESAHQAARQNVVEALEDCAPREVVSAYREEVLEVLAAARRCEVKV